MEENVFDAEELFSELESTRAEGFEEPDIALMEFFPKNPQIAVLG